MSEDDATGPHAPGSAEGGRWPDEYPPGRPAVAGSRMAAPSPGGSAEHGEPHAPLSDMADRERTFEGMANPAVPLGSGSFTALDAAGSRMPVRPGDGKSRGRANRPSVPQQPLGRRAGREGKPEVLIDTRGSLVDKQPSPSGGPMSGEHATTDAPTQGTAMADRIEGSLTEHYLITRTSVTVPGMQVGSTEYRFRGDNARVAFTASALRLETETSDPSVARSMIDLAQARNWTGLRVTGAEDFRRMVWLEATLRGVKALGYEPTLPDLDLLRRERESRQVKRIAPASSTSNSSATTVGDQPADRGGGRKAVVAAIDAILIASNVPDARRQAILAAAADQLARLNRHGDTPRIKVYDREATPQPPVAAPTPEPSHAPSRGTPGHVR